MTLASETAINRARLSLQRKQGNCLGREDEMMLARLSDAECARVFAKVSARQQRCDEAAARDDAIRAMKLRDRPVTDIAVATGRSANFVRRIGVKS